VVNRNAGLIKHAYICRMSKRWSTSRFCFNSGPRIVQ